MGVATISIDGQVVATATRENGSIVERSGKAIATLGAMLPDVLHTTTIEWVSVDGTRTQTHTLGW